MIPFTIVGFAVAFCLYVVAGYPLLLSALARRARRRCAATQDEATPFPSVSAIIPVRNGAEFLRSKLESLLALDYPAGQLEIWVVSDASTDETTAIARSYSSRGVKLLELATQSGKPAGLNEAAARCRGELLLLTDVRQKLDRDCLRLLVRRFADPQVGVVSGDLVIGSGDTEQRSVGLYWRYESAIRRNLADVDSMLGATGPIYAIRSELFVPIPRECLLDDMYLPLAGAFLQGYRLSFEPRAKAFDVPTGISTERKRKVRTLAGNYQLWWLLPALLSPRNRMLFHYVSLKVGRLLLPWAILVALVTSAFTPWPWPLILLGFPALFAAAAVLDSLAPPSLRRFTSLARTVIGLLSATMEAVRIFWTPPQQLWQPTNTLLTESPDSVKSGSGLR